ncbi:hypothetical protein [Hydrogenophaga luteola]|uniref:Uncharacterized protein n=1 Tax=Hydrogenophaga luteola TaxID=1591122 RepID=A0ABV7W6T4_9BURK
MNHQELHRLANGRRIMHLCLFGWLGMTAFQLDSTPLLLPLFLLLSGAAMTGSARVTGAVGMTRLARWACVLGAAVPIVGLLVMGWLSSKARRQLLAAGWTLGMFEARAPIDRGRCINEPVGPMGDESR